VLLPPSEIEDDATVQLVCGNLVRDHFLGSRHSLAYSAPHAPQYALHGLGLRGNVLVNGLEIGLHLECCGQAADYTLRGVCVSRRDPASVEAPLPVSVLATQADVEQHDFAPHDVIAKAEAPEPQPVLTFSGRHSPQLLDGMRAADVVRIFSEQRESLREELDELGMALGQRLERASEARRSRDFEAGRHFLGVAVFLRRRFTAIRRREGRRSSAGEDSPARCSRLA